MQVFLPDLMELLQNENEDIKMKALVVIQKLMGHLEKVEGSRMAVPLAEELLPLFDEVRLMGEPKPRRRALGKDSCPSVQPCKQCSEQSLLLCFLPRAPLGQLLGSAAQPRFSLAVAPRVPRAPKLCCGAGPDVLPRLQGKGLSLSRWGMARRHC